MSLLKTTSVLALFLSLASVLSATGHEWPCDHQLETSECHSEEVSAVLAISGMSKESWNGEDVYDRLIRKQLYSLTRQSIPKSRFIEIQADSNASLKQQLIKLRDSEPCLRISHILLHAHGNSGSEPIHILLGFGKDHILFVPSHLQIKKEENAITVFAPIKLMLSRNLKIYFASCSIFKGDANSSLEKVQALKEIFGVDGIEVFGYRSIFLAPTLVYGNAFLSPALFTVLASKLYAMFISKIDGMEGHLVRNGANSSSVEVRNGYDYFCKGFLEPHPSDNSMLPSA